ncbi:hypothetical protein ACEW7V_01075 [Areca yellow leaf disease phytoplasma]|uniref:hypothetical protein n=1 Tax=Areca yellow leaf disease phytoplasma TaxID=927614 RepID=UPI0035B5323A
MKHVKLYGPAGELMALVNRQKKRKLSAECSSLQERFTGNDITMPLAKAEHYQFFKPEKIADAIKKVVCE